MFEKLRFIDKAVKLGLTQFSADLFGFFRIERPTQHPK
jgi:hypothetical protein